MLQDHCQSCFFYFPHDPQPLSQIRVFILCYSTKWGSGRGSLEEEPWVTVGHRGLSTQCIPGTKQPAGCQLLKTTSQSIQRTDNGELNNSHKIPQSWLGKRAGCVAKTQNYILKIGLLWGRPESLVVAEAGIGENMPRRNPEPFSFSLSLFPVLITG